MSIDDPFPPDIIYTSHLLRGTNILNNLKKGPVFYLGPSDTSLYFLILP